MMTARTRILTPEEIDVAEHPLGEEGGLSEEAERYQHEARQRRQLEFDQCDEELDGEDEEGEQNHRPGEQQAGDLDEILEEGDPTHQVGDRLEQRPGGIEAGLGDTARPHQVGRGEAGTGRHQAEAGKALEDDAGQIVPVADDVGEDADKQGLLDETREDVVVGAPGPEERGEGHIDDDQRCGEKRDLTAQETEPAVDVTGEDLEEAVDDASAAHGLLAPRGTCVEEAAALIGPGIETVLIVKGGFSERLTAPQFGAVRIGQIDSGRRGPDHDLIVTAELQQCGEERDEHEDARAEPNEHRHRFLFPAVWLVSCRC